MTIKKKRHRLLSVLLCYAMLVGLLPTTALATERIPDATAVSVDGGKAFGEPNRLHYKNNDKKNNFTGSAADYNAHYDPDTGVLTLNNYDGKDITIGGAGKVDITIQLMGVNTVTGSIKNTNGGDITITGNGSLEVNSTRWILTCTALQWEIVMVL